MQSVQTARNLRERRLQARGSELKARWDRPYECEGFHRSCGAVEAPTDYLCPLSRVVTAPGRLFGGASPSDAIRNHTLTTKPNFINDVVLTRRYAWFTDSQQAQLYGVPLGRNGRPGGQASVVALPLTGDLGAGRRLQCRTALHRLRTARHCLSSTPPPSCYIESIRRPAKQRRVDLGGTLLTNGDGLLVRGKDPVRGSEPAKPGRGYQVECLRHSWSIDRHPEKQALRRPNHSGGFREEPYLPNARFTTPPTPTTEYWITRIDRI